MGETTILFGMDVRYLWNDDIPSTIDNLESDWRLKNAATTQALQMTFVTLPLLAMTFYVGLHKDITCCISNHCNLNFLERKYSVVRDSSGKPTKCR